MLSLAVPTWTSSNPKAKIIENKSLLRVIVRGAQYVSKRAKFKIRSIFTIADRLLYKNTIEKSRLSEL